MTMLLVDVVGNKTCGWCDVCIEVKKLEEMYKDLRLAAIVLNWLDDDMRMIGLRSPIIVN